MYINEFTFVFVSCQVINYIFVHNVSSSCSVSAYFMKTSHPVYVFSVTIELHVYIDIFLKNGYKCKVSMQI